jgi:hypothetical protein
MSANKTEKFYDTQAFATLGIGLAGGAVAGAVLGKSLGKNVVGFTIGGAVVTVASMFVLLESNRAKSEKNKEVYAQTSFINQLQSDIQALYAGKGVNYSTTDQNADIYVGDVTFR